jgi:hypothetical protein
MLGDGSCAVADAELGVDVQQVRLHRRLADEQLGGGLLVRHAGCHQFEYLKLTLAERLLFRRAQPAPKTADDGRCQHRLAARGVPTTYP